MRYSIVGSCTSGANHLGIWGVIPLCHVGVPNLLLEHGADYVDLCRPAHRSFQRLSDYRVRLQPRAGLGEHAAQEDGFDGVHNLA